VYTFQELGQRRIVEYHVLHVSATSSCVVERLSVLRLGGSWLLLWVFVFATSRRDGR
jgi:hypothetical protein